MMQHDDLDDSREDEQEPTILVPPVVADPAVLPQGGGSSSSTVVVVQQQELSKSPMSGDDDNNNRSSSGARQNSNRSKSGNSSSSNSSGTSSTSTTKDWDARKAMNWIASRGKTGYAQITLYNSFAETGTATQGIGIFTDIHTNLMTLHGFMAGFQYLALDGTTSTAESATTSSSLLSQIIFMIRVIGLILSFFGVLTSLITVEYLKSMIHEPIDLQVLGIMRYHRCFLASDQFCFASTIMLLVTVNLMCYHNGILSNACSIIINIISTSFLAFGLTLFKIMIIDRQTDGQGRKLYQDPIWIAAANTAKKNRGDSTFSLWLADWSKVMNGPESEAAEQQSLDYFVSNDSSINNTKKINASEKNAAMRASAAISNNNRNASITSRCDDLSGRDMMIHGGSRLEER